MTLVKKISIFIGITIISLILLYFSILIILGLIVRGWSKEELAVHKRLLCETDYKIVLQACRELPKFVYFEGEYNTYTAEDILNDPNIEMSDISREVIDSLKTRYINIFASGLVIFFMGNPHWNFGISAYPEDYTENIPLARFGDRELIPGLWYFDERYRDDTRFGKSIEKLIKKNKYLK